MTISDICDQNLPQVSPRETLDQLNSLFIKSPVVIVKDGPQFIGLVDREHASPDPRKPVGECVADYPVLTGDMSLEKALIKMKSGGHSYLPVFVDNKFDGVLQYSTLFHAFLEEHRHMKQNLFRLEENALKEKAVDGYVHDLNNLLAVILGNAEMAELEKDPERFKTIAHVVREGVEKSTKLLRRFQRNPFGFDVLLEQADVKALLMENRGFLQSIASDITLHFDFAPAVFPVLLDTTRFFQVISNLMINAGQAMPDGGEVRMLLENFKVAEDDPHTQLQPGVYVHLAVSDTGQGIASEHLNMLFTPYITTKPHGNGLGLATSRQIVEAHNGTMTVTSEEGQGATFHIFLPALK